MYVETAHLSNRTWGNLRAQKRDRRLPEKEELRQRLDALLQHPLARAAAFAPDGYLVVSYPAGYFPNAVRIAPIRENQILMVERAIRHLNAKLEREHGDR